MIITDSGGIQKEAYWCKIPCVTLLENSPWPETVIAGWNFLAGVETERILKAANNFQPSESHKNIFGAGKTSKIIVEILLKKIKHENFK